tara:strand:+ start:739 stop:1431 length:693 start_codon:yes stop_codon:yes gene_type:complete
MTGQETTDKRIPRLLSGSSGNTLFYHEAINAYARELSYSSRREARRKVIPHGFFLTAANEVYREDIREDCMMFTDLVKKNNSWVNREMQEFASKIYDQLEAEIKARGVDRSVTKLDYYNDDHISSFVKNRKFYPESLATGYGGLKREDIISPEFEETVDEFNRLVEQVREMRDPTNVDRDRLDSLLRSIGERVDTYTERGSAIKFYELYDGLGRTPGVDELRVVLNEEVK